MSTKLRLFALFTCAVVGCGDGSLAVPRTAPATGSVTYKGKPAAGVKVTLHPQFEMKPNKFTPHGMTGKDGNFTLSTGKPDDGAPPGDYVVTFEMIKDTTDGRGTEIELDVWKGKHADPATSPHKATIGNGDNTLGPYNLD